MKEKGEKISMLTAYDYTMARLLDGAGVDILLVGDSLASVVMGKETTLSVRLTDMIRHGAAVSRAVQRALVVVDLPFGTYQEGATQALRSATRLMRASAQAVKLEGGASIVPQVKKITAAGIPVMGHLGLTPQHVHALGGYGTRAQTSKEAATLKKDAEMLFEAGCFALVLEKIPAKLGKEVCEALPIPVIGIGAGPFVDGQVLVTQDMLGMSGDFHPRFLRTYANLTEVIAEAVAAYTREVKSGSFPSDKESY